MNPVGGSSDRPSGPAAPGSGDRAGRHRRPRDEPETPPSLGGSVDEYLASQGLVGLRTLADIDACWVAVVGSEVAAHARPRSLAGDELVVAVDHPAWATQLAFLSETICNRLADQLGYRAVERVKGHVDPRLRLD